LHTRTEAMVIAYITREHDRGRSLSEVLEDPFVTGRMTRFGRGRLLDDPDVVRLLRVHRTREDL
jgi:hypothetical protein